MMPFEVWSELTDKPDAPEPALVIALPNVHFLPTPLTAVGQDAPDVPEGLRAGARAAILLARAHSGSSSTMTRVPPYSPSSGRR